MERTILDPLVVAMLDTLLCTGAGMGVERTDMEVQEDTMGVVGEVPIQLPPQVRGPKQDMGVMEAMETILSMGVVVAVGLNHTLLLLLLLGMDLMKAYLMEVGLVLMGEVGLVVGMGLGVVHHPSPLLHPMGMEAVM